MNEILDRLRDHRKAFDSKIDRDFAWSLLKDSYDNTKPARFASGICVSSAEKNTNGNAFVAAGATVTLPIPLLLEHRWEEPVGKIVSLEFREDRLFFKATISNCGRQLWVDDLWMSVVCNFVTGASVGPRNLASYPPCDGRYCDWAIDEISITAEGADPGARITRCWEREPVVYLDGRPSERIFWSAGHDG